MTEYIIIAALVAIAAIGAITTNGNTIRQLFNGSSGALAGNTNVANPKAQITKSRDSLADFGDNNMGH